MDTKTCRRCFEEKPIERFPQRSGRPIGQRSSYCIVCLGIMGKESRKRYRLSEKGKAAERRRYYSDKQMARRKSEGYRAKRAEYEKTPAVKEYRRMYRTTSAGIEARRKSGRLGSAYAKAKSDRKNFPMKAHARDEVKRAINDGRLQRGACANASMGGCKGVIGGHHHLGYDREHWLNVMWLCRRHHWLIHHGSSQPNPVPCQR